MNINEMIISRSYTVYKSVKSGDIHEAHDAKVVENPPKTTP